MGYRPDPAPGLASRVMHFEYGDAVGRTLMFRLVGSERLREATVGTGWTVAETVQPDEAVSPYRAVLEKSG